MLRSFQPEQFGSRLRESAQGFPPDVSRLDSIQQREVSLGANDGSTICGENERRSFIRSEQFTWFSDDGARPGTGSARGDWQLMNMTDGTTL